MGTDPVMLIHENAQTDKISARVVRSIGDTQEKDDSSTQTESHLLLSSSSVITPSYMEAMEDQGIVTVSPHYEDNEDNFIDIPENVTQIYVKYFTNTTENAEETMEHVTDSTEHASIITNYVKDATEV